MDWGTVAVLALIVCAEGVERVESDSVIARQGLSRRWMLTSPIRLWRNWRLVSSLPALSVCLVLPAPLPDGVSLPTIAVKSPHEVLNRIQPMLLMLRVLGFVESLVLVLGVPWSASHFGVEGLLGGVALALFLSFEIALVATLACTESGATTALAFRTTRVLLSPFASPRAADVVLSAALNGQLRGATLRALLTDADIAHGMRPWVYDAAVGHGGDQEHTWRNDLGALLTAGDRERILNTPPIGSETGSRFCPRCGALFRADAVLCSDCSVRLTAVIAAPYVEG